LSDERDVQRGLLAQSVLDNTVYIDSYGVVEQEIIRSWRDARNAQDREQLHQMLLMLGKARNALESVMRSGKLAQDAIIQKRNLLQRAGAKLRGE